MKILVAEDNPTYRMILEAMLRMLGHEVVAVESGLQAWEVFQQEPVRVIVSDWEMPELDGLELCRRVRAMETGDYTYFVLLTGAHTDENSYYQAMDAGIDDYLTKPLTAEAIRMRLRVAERILGYTRQIRQLNGLLPICMYCKKIRNDEDYWQQIESYIRAHTGTDFSHTVCPDCYKVNIEPQLEELRAKKQK